MRPWTTKRQWRSTTKQHEPTTMCRRNDSFSAHKMGKSNGTHSGGCDSAAARDLGRVSRAASPLYLRNRVSWSRQTGPLHFLYVERCLRIAS
jgi:hypothetical protein